MMNRPNCKVEIDGINGEVFVYDNGGGRYMCVFVKTDTADYSAIYDANGFMVSTPEATHAGTEFFPIKQKEDTKLNHSVMYRMWTQIVPQLMECNQD